MVDFDQFEKILRENIESSIYGTVKPGYYDFNFQSMYDSIEGPHLNNEQVRIYAHVFNMGIRLGKSLRNIEELCGESSA